MFYVATTRFNEKTWLEYNNWMKKKNVPGCVYNSPMRISDTIPIRAQIFVLEMNNDINKIMGIGIIRNTLWNSKKLRIYQDHCYNRYCYEGCVRIDRRDLLDKTVIINGVTIGLLRLLEVLCFMGSTHSKRNRGISLLPQQVINNGYINIEKCLHKVFNK